VIVLFLTVSKDKHFSWGGDFFLRGVAAPVLICDDDLILADPEIAVGLQRITSPVIYHPDELVHGLVQLFLPAVIYTYPPGGTFAPGGK
jgi:hypothetical protein